MEINLNFSEQLNYSSDFFDFLLAYYWNIIFSHQKLLFRSKKLSFYSQPKKLPTKTSNEFNYTAKQIPDTHF